MRKKQQHHNSVSSSPSPPVTTPNVNGKRFSFLNVNATDALGRTSLRIAIENENLELVELLLSKIETV